ncbi:hypothetical protein FHS43_005707 [Streptosporangium becharense]|uniref:DUF4261 domain-containing protein n=1 Tax=Streptosporangium becharense TaxID=1816182 RepID=A0A7W9MKF4_9ACTN|nr:hypothetical protein [Streptosporangium becharense]MBB2914395.1 hypothetical protein [Streptosporangium becharense]MBB5823573.1 hypothetical protein [Streptosporangium becharense]
MFRQNYAVMPRHVLCVLGSGLEVEAVEKVVADVAGPGFVVVNQEHHQRGFDPRMPRSFESCLVDDSFTDSDWKAVREHDSVVYVLSPPMRQHNAFDIHRNVIVGMGDGVFEELWDDVFDVSRRTLAVTAALLRSGATAVKNDSSGLTHGRDHWLALADVMAGEPDRVKLAVTLFSAWVKRPLGDGNTVESCGMHLLGAPDVAVDLGRDTSEPMPAELLESGVELIDQMALYLLVEQRAREMMDGEGFRLAPDAQRWVLERHPCRSYEEDDFFHNPYGVWLLTPDTEE